MTKLSETARVALQACIATRGKHKGLLSENVFDYFTHKIGRSPNDATLADLPVDSVCGRDCKSMIDWTADW